MSTTSIPFRTALVGVRLHPRRASGGAPLPAPAQQLLDLEAREIERRQALQALRDLAQAAKRVVEEQPGQIAARLDEVAALAVELGLAVARELVGAALQRGLVDPTPVVVRCLRDAVRGSGGGDLVVRLHPEDLAAVQAALQALPAVQEDLATARLLADAGVPRGGVRAETGAGRLCYDPREVLERISAEVRREASA